MLNCKFIEDAGLITVCYGIFSVYCNFTCGDVCVAAKNVHVLLPLLEEYQVDALMERCEEFLLSEASSVRMYAIAQQYNLQRLKESVTTYLNRAPVSRLRSQPEWDELDAAFVKQLLTERCERFETHLDALREVRMVLERKKPTTFPGQHLLCASCTAAREQQVCMIFAMFAFLCYVCYFIGSTIFSNQYDSCRPCLACRFLRLSLFSFGAPRQFCGMTFFIGKIC